MVSVGMIEAGTYRGKNNPGDAKLLDSDTSYHSQKTVPACGKTRSRGRFHCNLGAPPVMLGVPSVSFPKQVGFLLIPDFSLMSFSSAIEPLRSANRMSGCDLYRWHLFSVDGQPVEASNGIPFTPHAAIGDIARFSTVIVVAGLEPQNFRDKRTFSWLRQLARHGTQLGAVSTGSYLLARAGLLNGYRCTIHWENLSGFMEEFPDLDVTTRIFAIDRDRFTCSGGTAALDMMLHFIAAEHGKDLANAVSEQFIHTGSADHETRQRMPLRQRLRVSHPKLLDVIAQMEANLEEPMSREELADSVGLSTRQVERLFRKYLGCTPARHYLELRLKRARRLLAQTSMSILDVSIACGFVSASHFSKCYREMFAHTPRRERAPAPPGASGEDPANGPAALA